MNKAFFSATNFERMDLLKDRVRSLGDQALVDMFEPLYLDFMLAYKRHGEAHWVEDHMATVMFDEYGPYRQMVGRRRRRK